MTLDNSQRFLRRCAALVLLSVLMICSAALLAQPVHAAEDEGTIVLPSGFVAAGIAGLTLPTDMAFLPDGKLLVLEKGAGNGPDGVGAVRLVTDGQVRPEPVMTLATNPYGDSGLLGLAIDPSFSSNGFIYVWHATGSGSLGWNGETKNRLSRFTVDRASYTVDPATERIVLDAVPWALMHNGGGLAFDADGLLYLAVGDATNVDAPQTPGSPGGKLLRFRPTPNGYTVPADNPFVGEEDALDEVFALGLRNPFRIAHRDSDNGIYVADVGNAVWEEVNLAAPRANYGWPEREGPCPLDEYQPCAPAAARFTDPRLYYAHAPEQGGSITGLDFYTGGEFPAPYQDQLFFADFDLGTIAVGEMRPDGFSVIPFAANVPGIVDIEYHDQALYYLEIFGKIGVIRYTGVSNQAPVASLSADVALGAAPLRVQFDAVASFDGDGEIVGYRWAFGDGSAVETTTRPAITHSYAADGTYRASVTVIDDQGAESEAAEVEIQVYSGEIPAIRLTNLTDAGRLLFHGGDQWEYAVVRSGDGADLDPVRPFVWNVEMHHNQHGHPVITDRVTASARFDVSTDNHGGAWNIWYRFHLTMNTATGQQVQVSADLRPAWVTLGVDSHPGPTSVIVNGGRETAPYSYRAIAGTEHTIEAPAELLTEGGVGAFDQWHVHAGGWPGKNLATDPPDLNARTLTFSVPATSSTYTAYYRFVRPADKVFLPMIAR